MVASERVVRLIQIGSVPAYRRELMSSHAAKGPFQGPAYKRVHVCLPMQGVNCEEQACTLLALATDIS